MQKQINLYPLPGQHLTIIGQTGSGKTTGALALLIPAMRKHIPVAILDTKGESKFSPLGVKNRLKLIKHDQDIIIYRPDPEELLQEDLLQTFLLMMYNRARSGIVYVDELSSLGTSPKPGVGLLSLLARGREHLVGKRLVKTTFIGATQRPRNIPLQIYTESRAFMVYRLNDVNDRKRVAAFTHPSIERMPPIQHSFWYFRDTDNEAHLMKIKLPKMPTKRELKTT